MQMWSFTRVVPPRVSTSRSVAAGCRSRSSASESARPSCLHGVHCPHDSTARKRATPPAIATGSVVAAQTMKAAARQGTVAKTRECVRTLVASETGAERFVTRILGRELGLV